jgi:hypothetical protein
LRGSFADLRSFIGLQDATEKKNGTHDEKQTTKCHSRYERPAALDLHCQNIGIGVSVPETAMLV